METKKGESNTNITFLGLLQLLFIYLKATGNIDWSWWMVWMPTWISFGIYGIVIIILIIVGLISK